MVPALNEAGSITNVVRDARQILGADVVVVDDGSTDDTADLARAAGATVVSHPYNLGVGGAIRTALKFAKSRHYDVVVQLDGDGQHGAQEAKRLIDELRAGGVDLVVGSRFSEGYVVSRGRRLAMRTLSRLVSRRVGTKVTDTTSGFRAMNGRAIDLFASAYPIDYLSDTVEALLIGGDAGLRIREVDVRMYERQAGRPSTRSLRSIYHLLRLSLVIFLHSIRRRRGPQDDAA